MKNRKHNDSSRSNPFLGDNTSHGIFTCAEDYEEHMRLKKLGLWECNESEMA